MPGLSFSFQHSYASRGAGIAVPITLRSGEEIQDVVAFLDTGAEHCVFEHEVGSNLGLRIEDGEPKSFLTAAGRVETFGHTVTLRTFDIEFDSTVYFFADEHIRKNLLGRNGWLDRIRLGLVHHDSELFLAPYDL